MTLVTSIQVKTVGVLRPSAACETGMTSTQQNQKAANQCADGTHQKVAHPSDLPPLLWAYRPSYLTHTAPSYKDPPKRAFHLLCDTSITSKVHQPGMQNRRTAHSRRFHNHSCTTATLVAKAQNAAEYESSVIAQQQCAGVGPMNECLRIKSSLITRPGITPEVQVCWRAHQSGPLLAS